MEGEDADSDDPGSFQGKPAWKRFLIVAAGPVFNFILAYVLAVILVAFIGYTPATVSETMVGYPAEEAGIQAGDLITDINGYSIHFYQEVHAYIYFHTGKELSVTYERDGREYTSLITPKYDEETDSYYIGIRGGIDQVRTGIVSTLTKAFWEVRYLIYVTIQSLKMLVTGQLGVNDLSGPVGIVKTIGDTYEQSIAISLKAAILEMINLTIPLSANLGVMNLLPFPALGWWKTGILSLRG